MKNIYIFLIFPNILKYHFLGIHCLADKKKCQQIVKFLHYVENIRLVFFVSDCSIHTIRFHFILRIQEGSFVVCISVNELHFKSVIASHKIVGKKLKSSTINVI